MGAAARDGQLETEPDRRDLGHPLAVFAEGLHTLDVVDEGVHTVGEALDHVTGTALRDVEQVLDGVGDRLDTEAVDDLVEAALRGPQSDDLGLDVAQVLFRDTGVAGDQVDQGLVAGAGIDQADRRDQDPLLVDVGVLPQD